ncbi:hypothetical protein H9P43_008949 [Blastocladiella emersonii ATCC 22665]|nr:hypothetical protein H9P43_008949 [Blastocladiella emersonii ATCC 22665]
MKRINRAALGAIRPLGVYVHYPYCRHRCAYCAFNVYKVPGAGKARVATEAYVRELRHALTHENGGVKYRVRSVYFGGGTPSLAPLGWFKACLDAILDGRSGHEVDPDLEVTVEANPSDVTESLLTGLRALGVNRLSLGIQALDAGALAQFERDHTVDGALRALEQARRVFPGRVTADFIWGRPGQTVTGWTRELERVLGVADDHLSLYQLTLERGTRMFKSAAAAGREWMPSEDAVADMYEATASTARAHGFAQYEVSSFARGGAVGKHNSGYWHGYDYAGIGPGAHGRITSVVEHTARRVKTFRIRPPAQWEAACLTDGHGLLKRVAMDEAEVAHEAIMFGLRMAEVGVDFAGLRETTGVDVARFVDWGEVGLLAEAGLLERPDGADGQPLRVRCTARGLAVADALLPRVILG